MKALLDTNALLYFFKGTVPAKIRRRLERPQTEIFVSVVSFWEFSLKPDLSRDFSTVQLQQMMMSMGASLLPLKIEHTDLLRSLSRVHNHDDPFDRMLIAQALYEACTMVSSDQRFPDYCRQGLKLLWD